MKRISLLLLATSLGVQLQAQNPKVVSAFNYLNYYLKDKTDVENLKNAQENIDAASLNEGPLLNQKLGTIAVMYIGPCRKVKTLQ
jgi:hypothetical protein